MFGTMGVTELILILAIVLIVFGAGKLPKIGEGVGKALKGFKKEMREVEPPPQAPEQAQAVDAQVVSGGPQPVPPPQPSGQPAPPPVATAARSAADGTSRDARDDCLHGRPASLETGHAASSRAAAVSGRNTKPRSTGRGSRGAGAVFRLQSRREQARRRTRHGPASRVKGQAGASTAVGGEPLHDGSPGVGSSRYAAAAGSPGQQGSQPKRSGKAWLRHWRRAAHLPRGRQ